MSTTFTARLSETSEALVVVDADGEEVANGTVPASEEFGAATFDAELARVADVTTLRTMPFRRVGDWDPGTLSCTVVPTSNI